MKINRSILALMTYVLMAGPALASTYSFKVSAEGMRPEIKINRHTFTNCDAIGQYGPTLANCNLKYTAPDSVKFLRDGFQVISGIQYWTVPENGLYSIVAAGAAGSMGNGDSEGGEGARVKGDFSLIKGQVIRILVGQKGTITDATPGDGSSGGGGGGSFVVKGSSGVELDQVLIIAGGGGGGNDARYQGGKKKGPAALESEKNRSGSGYIACFNKNGSGGSYARSGSIGTGGFGCGAVVDDVVSQGGGWTVTDSKNNGENQVNESGVITGDGYVTISKIIK